MTFVHPEARSGSETPTGLLVPSEELEVPENTLLMLEEILAILEEINRRMFVKTVIGGAALLIGLELGKQQTHASYIRTPEDSKAWKKTLLSKEEWKKGNTEWEQEMRKAYGEKFTSTRFSQWAERIFFLDEFEMDFGDEFGWGPIGRDGRTKKIIGMYLFKPLKRKDNRQPIEQPFYYGLGRRTDLATASNPYGVYFSGQISKDGEKGAKYMEEIWEKT